MINLKQKFKKLAVVVHMLEMMQNGHFMLLFAEDDKEMYQE